MWNVGLFIAVGLVTLMGIIAALEGNFTVGQQERRGVYGGLPVTRHFALWSDLFVLPFIVGIMWTYRGAWSWEQAALAFIICGPACAGMHVEWMRHATSQECLLSRRAMTWCGWVHFVYMTFVVTLALLFFLLTQAEGDAYVRDRWAVGILLIVHLFIATFLVSRMKKSGQAPTPFSIAVMFLCTCAILAAIILHGAS